MTYNELSNLQPVMYQIPDLPDENQDRVRDRYSGVEIGRESSGLQMQNQVQYSGIESEPKRLVSRPRPRPYFRDQDRSDVETLSSLPTTSCSCSGSLCWRKGAKVTAGVFPVPAAARLVATSCTPSTYFTLLHVPVSLRARAAGVAECQRHGLCV